MGKIYQVTNEAYSREPVTGTFEEINECLYDLGWGQVFENWNGSKLVTDIDEVVAELIEIEEA